MAGPQPAPAEGAPRTRRGRRRVALVSLGCLLVWLAVSAAVALVLFLGSSRTVTVASHDAQLRPTFTGMAVLYTGPVLPDLRVDLDVPVGVEIQLGKTEAASLQQLVARYGAIAAAPGGQEAKLRDTVEAMAVSAALRGAVAGTVVVVGGIAVWLLIGRRRRHELRRRAREGVRSRRGVAVVATAAAVTAILVVTTIQPWTSEEEYLTAQSWTPLQTFLGPEVDLPPELDRVEVRGDVTTAQTRRLINSAIDSFTDSREFYADAVAAVDDLELREPTDEDTVVVLVSDRHDNIGMDSVVEAVAAKGGATAAYDAGDDTSTGSSWEDFSLDSLDAATRGLEERYAVAGNHDHGDFTSAYLAERGWTMLEGEVVDGPGGTTILGIPDPRSSGLGAWRATTGTTFSEAEEEVADIACAAQEDGRRVTTVLVHDANLGRETLHRGCADLVLGGHVHVEIGPTEVLGTNGETGWKYTTGTTGGAAYAFALGRPRRTAQITLVTYRDGRPYGLQAVELLTNGVFQVGDFDRLD